MPGTIETDTVNEEAFDQKAAILVVDDEPANLYVVQVILDSLGYPVVTARSGEEALDLMNEREFAVVLLDVQMSGWDGFETAKRIREIEKLRHVPLIFLTAFDAERSMIERAYSLGAVDFLVKPLVPIVLRAKVVGFVELFEKTQQIKWQAARLQQIERQEFAQKLAEENARLREKHELLQESEARYAAIVNTALDGIITIDSRGLIVEFNQASEAIFGYRREEALGRDIAKLVIPVRMRERLYAGLKRLVDTGETSVLNRRFEMSALRSDGEEFPVELTITQIGGGGPLLFTAYIRDLTERRQIERRRGARLAIAEVIASATSFSDAIAGILRAASVAVHWDVGSFWTIDSSAGYLRCAGFWSRPTVDVAEFEHETRQRRFEKGIGLPGRVWSSNEAVWIPDVVKASNFPRSAAAEKNNLHGAFGCPVLVGSEFIGVIEFFSHEIREPDGDLLEMIRTTAAQVGQFLKRELASEALRTSEQRFTGFMQHFPGLAWIKDWEGRYIYANEAALQAFGATEALLYGKRDTEVFPLETANAFVENDDRARASEAGIQTIETLIHPDGELRHSLVTKFQIPGTDGRSKLIAGMAIDITDLKNAEQALQEADRRKDEFLALLAHELRNPLAPLRNGLQVMRFGADKPDAVAESREMMERQLAHMVRLIDDLLDISRISRNKMQLRREKVLLADVVRLAIETARPLIEERTQNLEVTLPGRPVYLDADMTRLAQVFANLLTNSAKYTERGGSITLAAHCLPDASMQEAVGESTSGPKLQISVTDTGIGIPADALPGIFEMFSQVDRSIERSTGGLGIGLALVRGLIELHGGSVRAESDGAHRGSRFTVELPMLAGEAGNVQPADSERLPLTGVPRRFLVVDDNRDSAISMAMMLRLLGHDVVTAHDGVEAIETAEGFRPEVILMDLAMPRLNGYEASRQIREQPWGKDLILIALTGWGQEGDRERSRSAGCDGHLVKPVSLPDLERLLCELTEESPQSPSLD